MATHTLSKDDELELAFLDSDPRAPKRRVKAAKQTKKPDGDFKLLCGIIRRHSTGLWATIALVELAIIILVKTR